MSKPDWHNADIIASVRKSTGMSLRKLSLSAGLNQQSCQQCLLRPYLKAETVISSAIGVPAHEIWPSRYNPDGTRKCLLHSKRVSKKDGKSTLKHQTNNK